MTKYEMIFCIVNAGFANNVMDAARRAGARGGTIMHARGTASKEAEEKFGLSIQPEKDMVMLVVSSEIKDNVLKSLYEEVGLGSAGQGIAFSVPVNEAVGLHG